MSKDIFFIAQISVSILLIILVLLQVKGTGFGRAWGGLGGNSFSRRGLESLVFKLSFVSTALFITISIVILLV